ncbi:MAG: anthranilate phosphoribosyltransferase, partial [Methanomicrobiales archaeon HGW-Methanomicrobiales-5]
GQTRISEVREGRVTTYYLNPRDYGIAYTTIEKLKGGTAEENAVITGNILQGETGPRRDIVLLNAALALVASGVARAVEEGLALAASAIDTGKAAEVLDKLVRFTQALADPETKVG